MARVLAFEASWDQDAGVWWAQCTGPEGIVTEAETVEALRERLRQIVPDYLAAAGIPSDKVTIDLVVTVTDTVRTAESLLTLALCCDCLPPAQPLRDEDAAQHQHQRHAVIPGEGL